METMMEETTATSDNNGWETIETTNSENQSLTTSLTSGISKKKKDDED